jgi:ketosteroid isomerase-like protein
MRTGQLVLAVALLAAASTGVAQGQTPLVADAERALIEALARHDRSAFAELLAPDASFFLPTVTHGADAVVAAWLPFLMSGGNTMTLTAGDAVMAASGDLGYVTGTFTVTGQESGAPVKSASGEYVAVWRLLAGRWKLAALGGAAGSNARPAGGIGRYRFGMTPGDVERVSDCQPYTNVSQTGGLECANYTFEGRRMNISFIFASGRLRRIQLWPYEGSSEAGAREAIARSIDYLQRTAGGVSAAGLPGVVITADVVMDMLSGAHPEAGRPVQFDLSTPATSQPEIWFARIVKAQLSPQQIGYLVFLFADPRP